MSMSTALVAGFGAIIGTILGRAITTRKNDDGSFSIFDGDKEIARIPVLQEPMEFLDTTLKRISTTATSEPAEPSFTIANPLDKDSRCFSIGLVPDAGFKTKGMIKIKLDKKEIFRNKTVADFTDTTSLNVPIPDYGRRFPKDSKIEFFIWNAIDAVAINLTTLTAVGEYK